MSIKNRYFKEIILVTIFLILLFFASTNFLNEQLKLISGLIVFPIGFVICFLVIDIITKSDHSKGIKIYTSFVFGLSIYFSILFAHSLGPSDISTGYCEGYCIWLDIVSIGCGIFLSLVLLLAIAMSFINKKQSNYSINIRPILWTSYILIIILAIFFFSNSDAIYWLRAKDILP